MLRTERAYRRVTHLERKLDTRHKIQLGGLIIKAGLGEEERAVVLGILLEAKEKLDGQDGQVDFERWNRAGIRAFRKDRGFDDP